MLRIRLAGPVAADCGRAMRRPVSRRLREICGGSQSDCTAAGFPALPRHQHRNFVWYVNVAEGAELEELMTGRDGVRRAVSLPPGAATDQAVTALRRAAVAELARPVAEVVTGVDEPFVQVVYDIAVPGWRSAGSA